MWLYSHWHHSLQTSISSIHTTLLPQLILQYKWQDFSPLFVDVADLFCNTIVLHKEHSWLYCMLQLQQPGEERTSASWGWCHDSVLCIPKWRFVFDSSDIASFHTFSLGCISNSWTVWLISDRYVNWATTPFFLCTAHIAQSVSTINWRFGPICRPFQFLTFVLATSAKFSLK